MTEDSSNWHPALQKLAARHRRRLRLSSLVVFLMLSGLLLLAMVKALTSQDLRSLLTLGLTGLVLLPSIGLAGGLMWYIDRIATRKLASAQRLVSDSPMQIVRLTPIEALMSGHLVEMILSTEARIHAVFKQSMGLLSPHEAGVQLYGRSFLQGDELVAFAPNDVAFLGKVVEPKAAQRKSQWLRIFMWVGFIVVIIVSFSLFGPLL